ncbi:hypothetical protein SAMN03159338_0585 [Sphingomonas sp. NFR04]|nr:hypothetical protein SAMN03159338_0585 [Sphingomonas sp. NFR04]
MRYRHCDRRRQLAARTKLIALLERLLAASRIKEEEQPITGGIAFFSTQPAWSDYLFYSDTFVQPNGLPDAPRAVRKMPSAKPILR